ncbi:MAG: hypothetical protein HPM95_17220 [Alphaproteobacteria bacterium]|nr:hypothetical protein [Alphaproteobacteria bacterium]
MTQASSPSTSARCPIGPASKGAQNTIIGGASLWVMSGHEDEECGVAEFLNFLSSRRHPRPNWHQNTGYLPIARSCHHEQTGSGFYTETRAPISTSSSDRQGADENSKGLRLGNFDQIAGSSTKSWKRCGPTTGPGPLDSAVEH